MDVPKFLLAENPMASEQLFILYTGSPSLLFEAIQLDNAHEFEIIDSEKICYYLNSDGILELHYILLSGVYGLLDDKVKRITKKAVEWYGAYLKFEDENSGTTGRVLKLDDFSADYAGLKVIFSRFNNILYILYNGRCMAFTSKSDLKNHLKNIFKITDFDNVIINEIDYNFNVDLSDSQTILLN